MVHQVSTVWTGIPTAEDYHAASRHHQRSPDPQCAATEDLSSADAELSRVRTGADTHMPTITEGSRTGQTSYFETEAAQTSHLRAFGVDGHDAAGHGRDSPHHPMAEALHSAGNAARQNRGLRPSVSHRGSTRYRNSASAPDEYESEVVDLLDLVGRSLMKG